MKALPTRSRSTAASRRSPTHREPGGDQRERRRRRRQRGRGPPIDRPALFEGKVEVDIGPLGDFSQLVGFEDAVGRIGAIGDLGQQFSEGRATLSMRLDEPVELLRELEARSRMDFQVRKTEPDRVILDSTTDLAPNATPPSGTEVPEDFHFRHWIHTLGP